MNEIYKQLKSALKSELLPQFVGLRRETKELGLLIKKLIAKEPPEIQKAEVQNFPALPERYNVLVENDRSEELIKAIVHLKESVEKGDLTMMDRLVEVLVANEKAAADRTSETFDEIDKHGSAIVDALLQLDKDHLEVTVKNQPEPIAFPDVQRVEIIKQNEPRVKIMNSEPQDAVPVVLVSKDRRKFYDMITDGLRSQALSLHGVKDKLQAVIDAIEAIDITLDADTINVGLDDLEELNGKATKHDYGSVNIAGSATATLATITAAAGKTILLKGAYGSGENRGRFFIEVDGSEKWAARNTNQSNNVEMHQELIIAATKSAVLKVENLSAVAKDFEGSIYGYELG